MSKNRLVWNQHIKPENLYSHILKFKEKLGGQNKSLCESQLMAARKMSKYIDSFPKKNNSKAKPKSVERINQPKLPRIIRLSDKNSQPLDNIWAQSKLFVKLVVRILMIRIIVVSSKPSSD